MQIHHIFCLAPHISRGGTVENFNFSKVERMVQILSVASFKSHYPDAHFNLYADSYGLAFLQTIGLHTIYDSIDTLVLDNMPQINHQKFWAGSKIFAYADALEKVENCLFIDIDAILWLPLENFNFEKKSALVAAHYEPYNLSAPLRLFDNGRWEWDEPSNLFANQPFQLNASFLWFRGKRGIWLEYCGRAIHYMVNNPKSNDLPIWAAMCFAEQLLLLDHADKRGVMVETLGKMNDPNFSQYWTHLWAQKGLFRNDDVEDAREARNCLSVIQKSFPAYTPIAEKCFR
jgi:hypothetical protein